MRSWVDAAFAVHPDMKSHTGGEISFGTGGMVCKSGKQKLVTKSSTEAETVGASDYLPNTLWVQMFLKAQGYKVHQSLFEQDNESAIKLEKNFVIVIQYQRSNIHLFSAVYQEVGVEPRCCIHVENRKVRHCSGRHKNTTNVYEKKLCPLQNMTYPYNAACL